MSRLQLFNVFRSIKIMRFWTSLFGPQRSLLEALRMIVHPRKICALTTMPAVGSLDT